MWRKEQPKVCALGSEALPWLEYLHEAAAADPGCAEGGPRHPGHATATAAWAALPGVTPGPPTFPGGGGGVRPEVAQDAAFKNLVEPLPRVSSFQPAVGSMALKGIGPRPTAPVRASAGCGQQEPGRRGRLDWGCALPAWSHLGWEPPLLPVCHSGCIPEHGAGRRVTHPACRGTFGGLRKAVRDRFALQGGTGDFP